MERLNNWTGPEVRLVPILYQIDEEQSDDENLVVVPVSCPFDRLPQNVGQLLLPRQVQQQLDQGAGETPKRLVLWASDADLLRTATVLLRSHGLDPK